MAKKTKGVSSKRGRSKAKVEAYCAELEKIAREKKGLTPERLVEIASEEGSIFYDVFEWDKDKAAHSYRVWQARQFIKEIEVEIQWIGDGKPKIHNVDVVTMPAFHSVQMDGHRAYVPADRLRTNTGYREQVIAKVTSDLDRCTLQLDVLTNLSKWTGMLREATAGLRKSVTKSQPRKAAKRVVKKMPKRSLKRKSA